MKSLLTPIEQNILVSLIIGLKPKSVLEIGTGYGGSAYLIHQCLPDDGRIISLDPKPQPEAYDQFAVMSRGELMVGSSPADIPAQDYDFVFVDGDHSRSAVWLDSQGAYQYLLAGGHMLFHDYDHSSVRRALRKVERKLAWAKPGVQLCGGILGEHDIEWGGLYLLQKP